LTKVNDWAAMQQTAIKANRTLVTFWIGQESSMVFFVRPNGEFRSHPLQHINMSSARNLLFGTEANNLGGWYSTYRKYQRGALHLSDWMKQIDETMSELQDRLVLPILRQLNEWGDSRIALLTSGFFGLLPLHTAAQLLNVKGDGERLETPDIIFAPSVWVLRRCLERERTAETPLGIVATSGDGPELHFAPWEQESIRRCIEEQKGADTCICLPDGERPVTASAVADFLPTLSVAHFCCHGSWNPADPLSSALQLDAGSSLSLARLLGQTRCDQARLVILSASESAIGLQPHAMGEEYLGLPAGFLFAGARSVIGSLWSVPDLSTALLMRRLYEELLDGHEVPVALRSAQHWLRNLEKGEVELLVREAEEFLFKAIDPAELHEMGERPFAHPYYWGAFQVLGNPAPIFKSGNRL
jgi:CHAT domain-containing protein